MKPESAKNDLEKRIKQSGATMSMLTPAQGIRLMLDFYKVARPDCKLDGNGDMLLFQWGTHNWGGGRSFEFDITRQFIVAHTKDEDDDDAISQLSFRFHFAPSTEFDAIKNGSRWCRSPDELAAFEAFVIGGDAYRAVQDLRPSKVTLDYGISG